MATVFDTAALHCGSEEVDMRKEVGKDEKHGRRKTEERDLERKSTISGEIFDFISSSWRSCLGFSSYNQLSFGAFEPLP